MKGKITLAIIFVIIIGAAIMLFQSLPQLPLGKPVHAHALVDITICGEHKDIPKANSTAIAHEKKFLGLPYLHTHDDNIIHIEGTIQTRNQVSLGAFFDAINVPFDKDKIMNVQTGDLCNGKPGKLFLYVNNKKNTAFRNYIPFNTADPMQQVISIVFEPEGG